MGPSDVFLIRHAEAVSASAELRDAHRHLTDHGRVQARALGDRLRWHDCEPTRIWTSPLVRAVQTAELVAMGLHAPCSIETVVALSPEGAPSDVVAALARMPGNSIIMLVGHMPTITAIGAELVRARSFGSMGNAEVVRIHHDRVRYRFAWDAEAPTTAS